MLAGNSEIHWTATPGHHLIEFTVDSGNEIGEINEANNSIVITVNVQAAPRADLQPTAILYDSTSIVPGNQVLFDAGVRNAGLTGTGDFNVRWMVDGLPVGADGSHAGVPAGATVKNDNSEFLWEVLPGRHSITFVVDYDQQVEESNETNNQRTVTVGDEPTLVDLTPTAISYPPAALYAGSTVLFDAGVRNAGSEGSSPFNVRWRVDGADVGAYGRHVGVPAGATIANGNSQLSWVAQPGIHTISFWVDSDNEIAETSEANNEKSVILRIADAPPADLKPTTIRYDLAALVVGQPVLFDAGVQNLGAGDSGSFNVRWLVDGLPVGADGGHENVPAGATVLAGNSQYSWIAQPGTHTISFAVDYDNRIAEPNETNNRQIVTVTPAATAPADLKPTTIRMVPAVPHAGDTVTFDSGVQNAGSGDSGVFNVRWLIDGQVVSGVNGSHGNVPGGSTVLDGNSQLTWIARAGTHTIGFFVDSDNHARETDESNNQRTLTIVVQGAHLINGDMETRTTPQYGRITGWGPNGGWSDHAQFSRPNNGSLGKTFGFYSAGLVETFGQVTAVTFSPRKTYVFKSWAYPGVNSLGRLPYQIGYAATAGNLGSFVPLATSVVEVTGNTSWVPTSGVTYRTGSSGPEIGKQLIVRFGNGADGGFDDIWFDDLTLTVQ